MTAAPALSPRAGTQHAEASHATASHAEETSVGLQTLVPGVAPITLRDRLAWRAAAPLEPKRPQRPADHGLFDLAARDQLDLFGSAGRAGIIAPDPELPPQRRGG